MLFSANPNQFLPPGRRNVLDRNRDMIGFGARSLDHSYDLAFVDGDSDDLSLASVGSAPAKSGSKVEALQDLNPSLRPPAIAKGALFGLRFNAALDGLRG